MVEINFIVKNVHSTKLLFKTTLTLKQLDK
jgi:hypothetical protein